MSEWIETTVGELVNLGIIESPKDGNHGGIHPKSSDYIKIGVPFIMASDLRNGLVDYNSCSFISNKQASILKKGKAKAGDILLSHKATIGRTAIVQESNFPITILTPQITYYRVIDEQKLNNKYLKYYFDSPYFQNIFLSWAGSGSTRAYLGITEQLKLPILLPDIERQNKIVKYLSALDNKIQLNTQTNQTLEQIAQAIYKSWFVDYEPTRAKAAVLAAGGSRADAENAAMTAISGKSAAELAALAQNHPVRYQQLADLAAAFPAALVPTDDFGEIPEGWEICTLKECSRKIQNGGTPKRGNAEFWDDGTIPWLSSGEVCNNKILIKSKEFITQSGLDNSSAKLVPSHSTLVAIYASPTAGKCSFCAFESTTNQAVCAVVPKSGYQYFNYFYLQRQEQYYVSQASGSAQQNISKKIVEETPIFQPTKEILGAFNKIIQPIMDKQISNLIENSKLEETRDSLLPKLINNELKRE